MSESEQEALRLLEQLTEAVEEIDRPEDKLEVWLEKDFGSECTCDVCGREYSYSQTYRPNAFKFDRVCVMCVGSYLNHGEWEYADGNPESVVGKLQWAKQLLGEARIQAGMDAGHKMSHGDKPDVLKVEAMEEELEYAMEEYDE